ncbi:hypothetical protein B0T26DRAFT_652555 [Lasiosphaeria miniovina]|uniref:BZIP domain-containing protein n=1 Tax=Lasiosphaeria miniovina TaxID=1954250 RepID=A0AA40A620_9PEZI|nr:uncharacterized protein B0T26DRAFT_652555 [Lasiosphaeria miniovina]KAK0709967.1 hypothetical protein B0T26DRAFT_652555 [Lasiosphaeria miniovina]
MRFPQGDLAILGAETYEGALPFRTPAQSAQSARAKKPQPASRNSDDGAKKRTKAPSSEGEDDEKKRARGRPRLDVKDETAADRRRTQIRLAQRAYRNRKENAIQSLEKKVQDLKDANEEMSNAFMKLHDFAVNNGLLDREPELGRHLRATTQTFLNLARSASDEGERDDDPNSRGSAGNNSVGSRTKSSSPEQIERAVVTQAESGTPKVPMFGGYTISRDVFNPSELLADISNSIFSHNPNVSSSMDYEIVTQPTLANASFPIGTVPDYGISFGTFSNAPAFPMIPSPGTYSSQEDTFGRRLHRFATERALRLLSMPNPPQARIHRVFGFCLLVETREQIRKRLSRVLARTAQENLSNWQYPFHNLGGAGTHFDQPNGGMTPSSAAAASSAHHREQDHQQEQQQQRLRIGSQGTIDSHRPRNNNGFSIGPFTPEVTEVRDNVLDDDMHMAAPGFRGEWLDCDEVELYLNQRGVTIPPGADYITADVDPSLFDDNKSNMSNVPEATPSSANMAHHTNSTAASSSLSSPSPLGPLSGPRPSPPPQHQQQPTGGDSSSAQGPWDSLSTTRLIDPLFANVLSQAGASGPFNGVGGNSGGDSSNSSTAGGGSGGRSRPPETIGLDINLLIHALTDRAACLGRTPGVRRIDINSAFWNAATRLSHGL